MLLQVVTPKESRKTYTRPQVFSVVAPVLWNCFQSSCAWSPPCLPLRGCSRCNSLQRPLTASSHEFPTCSSSPMRDNVCIVLGGEALLDGIYSLFYYYYCIISCNVCLILSFIVLSCPISVRHYKIYEIYKCCRATGSELQPVQR